MPAGDAQRVWFPEMLVELRRAWSPTMSWDALADFCQRMTAMRHDIRQSRGIRSPRFQCTECGSVTRATNHEISIRSALFALKNSGIVTEAEFKALDKSWKKHKAVNNLDPYGKKGG